MVNKVILVGRLAADPELRASPKGTHIANLRVATNTYGGKDEEGNAKEHSEFHRLVLFDRLAEFAGNFLRKGRMVYADGRIQNRAWDGPDGQKHYSTEIVVDTLQALGPKPGEPR